MAQQFSLGWDPVRQAEDSRCSRQGWWGTGAGGRRQGLCCPVGTTCLFWASGCPSPSPNLDSECYQVRFGSDLWGFVPECARVCGPTSVNGVKSLGMRMGQDGGFRDICVAPEAFLHQYSGLIIWVHHGDRMHVWEPVWALRRVHWSLWVCAEVGVQPWLWQNSPGA